MPFRGSQKVIFLGSSSCYALTNPFFWYVEITTQVSNSHLLGAFWISSSSTIHPLASLQFVAWMVRVSILSFWKSYCRLPLGFAALRVYLQEHWPIQKLSAIQKQRFRNYFDRFRNYDSETTIDRFRNYSRPIQKLFSTDSETIFDRFSNYFRPIQKLFLTDSATIFDRFRNYFWPIQQLFSTDSETIFDRFRNYFRPIQQLWFRNYFPPIQRLFSTDSATTIQKLRSGVGWGGDKFLHIERKITSLVHSHPPSHYRCKHMFLPTTWILMMFAHYPPFPPVFSWKLIFFGAWGSFAQVLAAASLFYPFDTHMRKLLGQHISFLQLWLPGHSSEARFPLGKETRSGRGWQHHTWIHTDLWTQDALYLRKHNESEPEECGRIPATAFSFKKNKECGSGRLRVM